jgi:hypothetical protein
VRADGRPLRGGAVRQLKKEEVLGEDNCVLRIRVRIPVAALRCCACSATLDFSVFRAEGAPSCVLA